MKKSEAKFDGPPDKREKARQQHTPEAARLSEEQRFRDPKGKKPEGDKGKGGAGKPKA